MTKQIHEVRDPIYSFIKYDEQERRVLDSRPFQRLRHILQLGMTFLIYPGATHKRFEHSLGVMELAGRVFDAVTAPQATNDTTKRLLPELRKPRKLKYWRRVLRMAALCHDIGHLPFSHVGEEVLPKGWNHERLTRKIILGKEMKTLWAEMTPRLRPDDIVKIAVGLSKATDLHFSDWETILSEIITGNALGVDRMDYLVRDSLHAGVPYGHIDTFRLIDTIRILPWHSPGGSPSVALGVEEGGIHCAAALLLARYFMFSQLYYHPVRLIYDIHLCDFLKEWLPGGRFSVNIEDHVKMTDDEVSAALRKSTEAKGKVRDAARRIMEHRHFKEIYRRNPDDLKINIESGEAFFKALKCKFGDAKFRHIKKPPEGGPHDFPVLSKAGRICTSSQVCDAIQRIPKISVDHVFAKPIIAEKAKKWFSRNRIRTIEILAEDLR